jgi:hemolysin III
MILVLIAGTYAPIALLLLRQPTQSVVLAVIAATTGLGIALRMIWLTAARSLIAGTYVACSSAGVVLLPVIANRAGFLALALVLGGALLYIAGATVYPRSRTGRLRIPRGVPSPHHRGRRRTLRRYRGDHL